MRAICFNQAKFSELFLTSESHVWVQRSSSRFLPHFPSFFHLNYSSSNQTTEVFQIQTCTGQRETAAPSFPSSLKEDVLERWRQSLVKSPLGGERKGQMEKDLEALTILSVLGTFL